jgi:quercetin dioxygenase-like cupin family protein
MAYEKTEIIDVQKTWGKEIWMANTELYCGKMLHVTKGRRCSMHYHENKDETFYFAEGRLLLEVEGDKFLVKKGDSPVRLLPGAKHRFSALEDSVIIEISTHHKDSDSYRIETSGIVPDKIMEEYSRES